MTNSHYKKYAYQSFQKYEGVIVIITYKKNLAVDLAMAKQLIGERLEYFNGMSYPTLADIRNVKLFTKEARDYLAKGDAVKDIPAGAILIGNYISVFMANVYMSFSRPQMPTKAFSTKEHALKWLMNFCVTAENPQKTVQNIR